MNPLFALPLYADGMDADSVLLFRYLMAMPVLAVMLLLRGHRFSGLTGRQLGGCGCARSCDGSVVAAAVFEL